jgi:bla regulator protein BlaR1
VSAVVGALLTYSAQVTIVVATAAAASWAVRLSSPAAKLHCWRAVVVLCLLLPFAPDLRPDAPAATVTFVVTDATAAPSAEAPGTRWILSAATTAVPWVIVAGIALRLGWLVIGAVRLRHLRRRSEPASLTAELVELHECVSPGAMVRTTVDVEQPVTFGWRRPVVLLPPRFARLTADAQRAVLCHELLHVRRRDWPGIVVEELLRAVFWFHPAIWWALEQVHLSREQLVDQLVLSHAPARRAYMEALLHFSDGLDTARPAIAFLRRRHLAARLRQLSKESHMTTRRLVSAVLVLAFVVAGTAATVLAALPLTLPPLALQGGTSLEVRLAEEQAAAGLVEAVVQGSDRRVYLRPGPLVTGTDVASAHVANVGGMYSINVTFSTAASNRLAEATKIHLGRPLAILLDGRVIAAPTLRSMIRGSAVINGDFTRAEAERIAAGLMPRGGAPARGQAPFTGQDAGVTLPKVLHDVKPQYTAEALQAKIQGDVELEIVVRADGAVTDVTVTRSLDSEHGLDEAAVEAARQWTFTPGTKDGQPADVLVHLNMRFTLK